jgi:O-antigen/teichoic acid export membrane protein
MKTDSQKQRAYTLLAFRIIGDMGATIAIPVVLLVSVAQYLSEKYGYGYWITVLAFVCSALISGYMVWKKAKRYSKEYNDIEL